MLPMSPMRVLPLETWPAVVPSLLIEFRLAMGYAVRVPVATFHTIGNSPSWVLLSPQPTAKSPRIWYTPPRGSEAPVESVSNADLDDGSLVYS
ncbi:hypothetical protein SAMN05216276_105653 [Streptosporangium subroseum]|uniref:Uncharacterized protein n=1 Tax=Streptosporangium subroseum TaxID=106412 RepID=A0A239NG67_9ACTN|nr:hypothetical protein [Streptosporangium subroseum]SNT53532.1 hypothetical protein SAMN05216276_105653 [Streptosporangium subroseum]